MHTWDMGHMAQLMTKTSLFLFLPGLSELVLHATAQHPTRPLTPCVRHLDARVARRKELEQADDDSFSSEDAESVASEEGEDAVEVVRDGGHGEGEGFVGAGLYRCGNAECQFAAAQGRDSIQSQKLSPKVS